MMTYGCHSSKVGPQSRGEPTTVSMQDGWRYLTRGGIVTREPVMRDVTTKWLPIKCGHLKQSGRGSDPLCAGCVNRGF